MARSVILTLARVQIKSVKTPVQGERMFNVEIHGFSASRAADIKSKLMERFANDLGANVTIYTDTGSDCDGCAPFFRVYADPAHFARIAGKLNGLGANRAEMVPTVFRELSSAPVATPESKPRPPYNKESSPTCEKCGSKMVPNGSCYLCKACGATEGCS